MDSTVQPIVELIHRSDSVDWGPECGALLGEAITLAQAAGQDQLAYVARLRLVINSSLSNDTELMLSTFVLCEAAHRRDPLAFPADPAGLDLPGGLGYGYSSLLWMWKWIPRALWNSPKFTRADVEASMDTLEAAYAAAGQGEKAVAERRLGWARHLGDLEAVAQWSGLVQSHTSDDLSDCDACSRSGLIGADLMLGETDRALRRWSEIIEGRFDCAEEPAVASSYVLQALADAGRVDDLQRAVRIVLDSAAVLTENIGAIGRLIVLLAQCSAVDRALTLTRMTLHRLHETPLDEGDHADFLIAVAIAGQAAERLGRGQVLMPQADDPRLERWLGKDAPWTAADLGRAAGQAARRIAGEFDARNGNTAQGGRVEQALSRGAIVRDCDLNLPTDPASGFLEEAGAASLLRSRDAVVPEPTGPQDAVRVLAELTLGGRPAEALGVARRWLDALDEPGVRLAALRMVHRALLLNGADDEALDEVHEQWQRCARELAWDALTPILRDIHELFRVHGAAPPSAAVRAVAETWLRADADPGARALGLAWISAHLDHETVRALPPTWEADATSALDRVGPHRAWPLTGMGLVRALAEGDPEQVRAAARDVLDDPEQLDLIRSWAHVCVASAWAAWAAQASAGQVAQGAAGQAADAAREALACAAQWAGADQRARGAVLLAQLSADAGRGDDAAAAATHAQHLAAEFGPRRGVETLVEAADVLVRVGPWSAAAACADSAMARAAAAGSDLPDDLRAGAQRARARVLLAHGNGRRAKHHFLQAAKLFSDAGDLRGEADAALSAAQIVVDLGEVNDAGSLAESVLSGVKDEPGLWDLAARAAHQVADAAARVGSEVVPPEAVDEAYALALSLVDGAPEGASSALVHQLRGDISSARRRWAQGRDCSPSQSDSPSTSSDPSTSTDPSSSPTPDSV